MMELELEDADTPHDWYLCSQCKRAFQSKYDLFSHKRQHLMESFNDAQDYSKRKRVEDWVKQSQIQLQYQQNKSFHELEKENEMLFSSSVENSPGEESSTPEEETTATPVVSASKRAEKTRNKKPAASNRRNTLAPVSNRVTAAVSRRATASKKKATANNKRPSKKAKAPAKKVEKKKTAPKAAIATTAARKIVESRKKSNSPKKESRIDLVEQVFFKKQVRILVKMEEYKFCQVCRGTFLNNEAYSSHLPCTHAVEISGQVQPKGRRRRDIEIIKSDLTASRKSVRRRKNNPY